MLKISSTASVKLSLVISGVFFAAIGAIAGFIPRFVELMMLLSAKNTWLVWFYNIMGSNTLEIIYITLVVVGYLILFFALLANLLLLLLLLQIKAENVFSLKSVGLIRGISWCAIMVGILFAVIGAVYYFVLIISLAALFLGLCVRVVKNVIEKATEIKDENDLTV